MPTFLKMGSNPDDFDMYEDAGNAANPGTGPEGQRKSVNGLLEYCT